MGSAMKVLVVLYKKKRENSQTENILVMESYIEFFKTVTTSFPGVNATAEQREEHRKLRKILDTVKQTIQYMS